MEKGEVMQGAETRGPFLRESFKEEKKTLRLFPRTQCYPWGGGSVKPSYTTTFLTEREEGGHAAGLSIG